MFCATAAFYQTWLLEKSPSVTKQVWNDSTYHEMLDGQMYFSL